MSDSLFSSPARSLGERSLGDPNSLTDSEITESECDVFELEIHGNPDQVIVDGWLKFRDNKKWKQRWGLVTKLSPAADCLHLQLYRDSRDRYKQGQTKASLSLQHFLGLETGFTLDKESNTIAIVCQDVTVVLAFDTRERLIQWQVKIASHLGEDQQFLVLVSQAPTKAKVSTGPARLHVQEGKFCMTSGVPPRLIGFWEIGHLRRYGVVEGRFCFEGGSRCGKGEGLYVLVTDQGAEITRTLQMAAQGKLTSKRPQAIRKQSVSGSPRKLAQPRQEIRNSETPNDSSSDYVDGNSHNHGEHLIGSSYWSVESRQTDLDSNYGCGDTASVHTHTDGIWLSADERTGPPALERCVSCISKLGAPSMSRSSTANTATLFSPAWTMEPVSVCTHQNSFWNSISDRISVSSLGTGSSDNSEYSTSRLICQDTSPNNPLLPPKNNKPTNPQPAPCHPPVRPPKPLKETSLPEKKPRKPPMPLPSAVRDLSQKTEFDQNGSYDNYDVPKTLLKELCTEQPLENSNARLLASPVPSDYYDTPKKVKENLCCNDISNYGNYDTPPPAKTIRKPCGCVVTFARQAVNSEPKNQCPCQRVMCWAENWMILPYCRRGQGIDTSSVPVHKVKLNGEGKMPVVNASGEVAVYATVDKPKKLKKRLEEEEDDEESSITHNINYENVDPEVKNKEKRDLTNYENIEFAQSLEHYENSKDLKQKAGITQEELDKFSGGAKDEGGLSFSLNNGIKVCNKCGHACKSNGNQPEKPETEKARDGVREDYLVMKPHREKNPTSETRITQHSNLPGYLPMFPGNKVETTKGIARSVGKSGSMSSLPNCTRWGRNPSGSSVRLPGSAATVMPSSANPSIRRILGATEVRSDSLPRKRSSSADSSRYLDEYGQLDSKESPFSSTTKMNSVAISDSLTTLPYQSPGNESKGVSTDGDGTVGEEICERTIVEDVGAGIEDECCSSSAGSLQTLVLEGLPDGASGVDVHIRRSSSVPCKSSNNRDSSSSNDSGVSTGSGSLRPRGRDFADFDLSSKAGRRENLVQSSMPSAGCLHASLPRRFKSSDPLRELTFHFKVTEIPAKSSSAEAEVPICPTKKEYFSPGESSTVPYLDSRSTSSGTSDMSDYIETLSLSSHSSSDAPESLPRISKVAASTLRPRSGNEYQKIDRALLSGDPVKGNQRGHYANVEPLPEKSESPSPGYASGSPAHEVQCSDC